MECIWECFGWDDVLEIEKMKSTFLFWRFAFTYGSYDGWDGLEWRGRLAGRVRCGRRREKLGMEGEAEARIDLLVRGEGRARGLMVVESVWGLGECCRCGRDR